MATCHLMSFHPAGDPSYEIKRFSPEWWIQRRSDLTHSEFQFSERYNYISVSATMRDDCSCFRFKMIIYDKHPDRWLMDPVELTDEQEDQIMLQALKMAGLIDKICSYKPCYNKTLKKFFNIFYYARINDIFYREGKALKYDKVGVVLCNVVVSMRIIRGHAVWVWCSEGVTILLQVAYPEFNGKADTQTPQTLRKEWLKFNG